MYSLIYLTVGFIFIAYRMFHLSQRGWLQPKDWEMAPTAILFWPALVLMAIDAVVDKIVEERKDKFAQDALNG
jgi:hypothetical protein